MLIGYTHSSPIIFTPFACTIVFRCIILSCTASEHTSWNSLTSLFRWGIWLVSLFTILPACSLGFLLASIFWYGFFDWAISFSIALHSPPFFWFFCVLETSCYHQLEGDIDLALYLASGSVILLLAHHHILHEFCIPENFMIGMEH